MNNFRTLGNYVVVEQTARDTVSKGGIIIPDTIQRESNMGTVVAVGERVNVPCEQSLKNGNPVTKNIKVGHVVAFPPHAANRIKLGDREYLILRDVDLFMVFE